MSEKVNQAGQEQDHADNQKCGFIFQDFPNRFLPQECGYHSDHDTDSKDEQEFYHTGIMAGAGDLRQHKHYFSERWGLVSPLTIRRSSVTLLP